MTDEYTLVTDSQHCLSLLGFFLNRSPLFFLLFRCCVVTHLIVAPLSYHPIARLRVATFPHPWFKHSVRTDHLLDNPFIYKVVCLRLHTSEFLLPLKCKCRPLLFSLPYADTSIVLVVSRCVATAIEFLLPLKLLVVSSLHR